MLKIPDKQQIRAWDQFTVQHEPIAPVALMERACWAFVQWFITTFPERKTVGIVCGTGDNGGDGLGIARLLSQHHYPVCVWEIEVKTPGSECFIYNKKRLPKDIVYTPLSNPIEPTIFNACPLLIDAIFGSGLSRPMGQFYQHIIQCINGTAATRIAVDMPSGLRPNAPAENIVVKADYTITFQTPKLSFLLPENAVYVGTWIAVDIGLSEKYWNRVAVSHVMITQHAVSKLLKKRAQFAHKGDFGKALLIAGSYGKMGACTLAAQAALRAGLGLLTVHIPRSGYEIVQTTIPEAMTSVDQDEHYFSSCPDTTPYTAVAIGPGLGQDRKTAHALNILLQQAQQPVIIDADGLNLLAAHQDLLHLIPKNSILTPHVGELARLIGAWQNDFDRLEKTRLFSQKTQSIIVLKGAYTAICTPEGTVYFNPTGNPGMATGGSGDTLTGILLGLLAQGIDPLNATIVGVYTHGLAGNLAANQYGQISMIASDIIDFLPQAFNSLTHKRADNTP